MADNKVWFTWSVDPPDPIDGERIKTGDCRRYDQHRAQRWATAGYGTIHESKPGNKPEKVVDFCWGVAQHCINGVYDIKPGTVQRLPISHAERYECAGYGSIGKELKPGWQQPDLNSETAQRIRREAVEAMPEEVRPKAVLVNIGRGGKPMYKPDGWLGY